MWQIPRIIALLLLIIECIGCASWSKQTETPTSLPAPHMSRDSVVLEIAFVRVQSLSADEQHELWNMMDEQIVPLETRHALALNGLRCGLVGSQVPQPLQKILDQNLDTFASLDGGVHQLENDVLLQQHRLQSRAGRIGKIVATNNPRERMAVVVHQDGNLVGETFGAAQCVFAVKTHPTGDGRARIELTPEIQYGPLQQQFVGREGSFRLAADRRKRTYPHLLMQPTLSPGEILLVAGTPEIKGLGRHFFVDPEQDGKVQTMLLIRLAQTQLDDLFAPDQIMSPIETPVE